MECQMLSDLKVADLRRELEKRRKDKSGVKQVLVDRLREALEEEGHDPSTFRFGNDVDVHVELELNDKLALNGDAEVGGYSKDAESVDHYELMDDQSEPKKLAEDSVPYVVHVGDQEEDLDYDLKADNEPHIMVSEDQKDDNLSDRQLESGKGTNIGTTSAETRRNLWISNLPKTVKAADLKQHFSKAGKVLSATVVMSTKSPGGCFGFLQMSSAEDAESAAHKFDGTEYNGQKLSVEATDRKPPTLATKPADRGSNLRARSNTTNTTERRPIRRFYPVTRRTYGVLRRNDIRRFTRPVFGEQRSARSPVRTFRPQRLNTRVLAYQSIKRASRLLAASRYGMVKGLQQAMEHSISRSRMLRTPANVPRSAMRYSTPRPAPPRRYVESERRELRRPPTPIRRSAPRPMSFSEHRRTMEPPYYPERPRLPTRRSEPVTRNMDEFSRARAPPISQFDRRRLSYPSPRPFDGSSRYERAGRFSCGNREFARMAELSRNRPEPRSAERMDAARSSRMLPNGNRHMASPQVSPFSYGRFKPVSEMSTSQRSPARLPLSSPKESPMSFRREYRDISRSPPRSRATPVGRTYQGFQMPRFNRDARDRSPLRASGSGDRPKIVDYGHRSEPRTNWPHYRNEGANIQAPPGHTWKPAGHTVVSNYANRGSDRRYM